MAYTDADKQRMASLLFPKQEPQTGGARTAVASGSSVDGRVQVVIGEVEYDQFGNEVVSLADLTVEVPIIGTAEDGEEVLIQIVNGNPIVIGTVGTGDATVQSITRLDSRFEGVDAQLSDLASALAVQDVWVKIDEGNGVRIGKGDSPFQVIITNTRMSFFGEGGEEVAYISNQQLYITEAIIRTKLRIGDFQFEPRTDGSMYLAWVGV